MNIPKPIITREHGSWAVLVVPMVIAVSIAEQFSVSMLLMTLAAVSAFMSYVPAQLLLRDWFGMRQDPSKLYSARIWLGIFGVVGAAAVFVLVWQGYWKIIPIGLFAVACFVLHFVLTRVHSKSVLSDLLAVAGLTVTAPAVLYVATGELTGRALFIWILNLLFFGSGVVYVHMKIAATSFRQGPFSLKQRLSLGFLNVVYHCVVFGIVTVLVAFEYTPTLLLLAFVPMTIHAIYGTLKLSGQVQFKKLGLLLLGHAVVFAILVRVAL